MTSNTAKDGKYTDNNSSPQDFPEAIEAAKRGRTSDAIKLLTKVTSNYPHFSIGFTNLGLQHLKNRDYDKAESYFRTAIKLNNNDAVAYNHLGVILREQGKFSDAQTMYKNALKHQPEYAYAHINLGILYDIYLYKLPLALEHYKNYQSITKNSDKQVANWIIDLERRIKSEQKG
ncbi:MAG: tetratricopeptide repeat protein [Gammaproteobacteria bacterium]